MINFKITKKRERRKMETSIIRFRNISHKNT